MREFITANICCCRAKKLLYCPKTGQKSNLITLLLKWVTYTPDVVARLAHLYFQVYGLYMLETSIIGKTNSSLPHKLIRGLYLRVQFKLVDILSGEYTGFSFYLNIEALDQTGNPAVLLQVTAKFSFAHSIYHGICCP